MDFNLPSNWWVIQLRKSEFAVLVLGFEKLGLGLDNCGRTTKNAYCRIYSLWLHVPLKNPIPHPWAGPCPRRAAGGSPGRRCTAGRRPERCGRSRPRGSPSQQSRRRRPRAGPDATTARSGTRGQSRLAATSGKGLAKTDPSGGGWPRGGALRVFLPLPRPDPRELQLAR